MAKQLAGAEVAGLYIMLGITGMYERRSRFLICSRICALGCLLSVTCISEGSSHAQSSEGSFPQASSGLPAFEISVVKLSATNDPSFASIETHQRNLKITNATVEDIIKWCYRIRGDQLAGAPSWIKETKFDITAEPEQPGVPTPDQDRLITRRLLAERFHLVLREGERLSSVYALSAQSGHLKIYPSNPQNRHNVIKNEEIDNYYTGIHFSYTTMSDLLYTLMNSIGDRQIVDETSLEGEYDFTLVVPTAALGDAEPGELGAALFSALHAVGLKLRTEKRPVRLLTIVSVSAPTPN